MPPTDSVAAGVEHTVDTVLVLGTSLGMIDVGRRIGGRVSCVCQRKKSWGNHTMLALQGMSVGATRVRMGITIGHCGFNITESLQVK